MLGVRREGINKRRTKRDVIVGISDWMFSSALEKCVLSSVMAKLVNAT